MALLLRVLAHILLPLQKHPTPIPTFVSEKPSAADVHVYITKRHRHNTTQPKPKDAPTKILGTVRNPRRDYRALPTPIYPQTPHRATPT